MSWSRQFDEPIETPDGKRLRTLREAVAYLAKTVPKSELGMPAVTTAAEMLTYAAERGIAWMTFARMATSRAIHRHEVPAVQSRRQRASLGQEEAEAG
jgi:hypothetical protein